MRCCLIRIICESIRHDHDSTWTRVSVEMLLHIMKDLMKVSSPTAGDVFKIRPFRFGERNRFVDFMVKKLQPACHSRHLSKAAFYLVTPRFVLWIS